MLTLNATDTLSAVCNTASAVSYHFVGDNIASSVNNYSLFSTVTGDLPSSVGTIWPTLAGKSVVALVLVNHTASPVTGVTVYANGTTAIKQLTQAFTIPANGGAVVNASGVHVTDSNGATLTTYSLAAASVANSNLADMAQGTFKMRAAGAGTGPPIDGTGAQASAALAAATTAAQGAMLAADKLKVDQTWVDCTNIGILTSNTGAQNVTAFNAWYTTAPTFVTLKFPGLGFYDFNAELTLNRDIRLRVLGDGKGRSILRSTSTTANLFNQTVAGYYISFEELGFDVTGTKTAGAAIRAAADNAYLDVRRCEFMHQYKGVELVAATAGNIGTINECLFTSPSTTAGSNTDGAQILINGSNINMMIQNCTINCTGVSSTGLMINQSGAVQVGACDFIGGKNTLLVNATGVVSALYFNNVFFDQATFGSTVKFMGTFATSRVKFIDCGITCGGSSGLVACEIAGTGSGTGIPEAIDFMLCDFYNNGFAGTTTGILATGVRGFDVTDCRISGFTFGMDLTPFSANGVTNFNIRESTIGPTENFAGNGTGIRINAGSFTFGPSAITDNDLSGNTTAALTDNGTYTTSYLNVDGNFGLAMPQKAESVATAVPLTTPVTRAGIGWAFLANTLRVGTRLRITVGLTCAATAQTLTPTLKMGTANTNADGDLWTSAAFVSAGTAALGSMTCVYDVHILSATTVMATGAFMNGAAGITGITQQPFTGRGSAGPITVASIVSTAFFIAPYFVSATAAAVTIRSVAYEVVAQ